jgi:hypothetical protein
VREVEQGEGRLKGVVLRYHGINRRVGMQASCGRMQQVQCAEPTDGGYVVDIVLMGMPGHALNIWVYHQSAADRHEHYFRSCTSTLLCASCYQPAEGKTKIHLPWIVPCFSFPNDID